MIILRFGEERGISSVSPVKLTTVLRNQIGDIHMAKVLKDGNLLIVCRNEEQNNILKGARRLQVTREGVRKDSEYVVLDSEEEVLPKKVTLCFLSYSVREYIPKPMRCYNCQKFGYTAMTCKSRRRCARCGEDNEYAQYHYEQPKCCNCGGNHSVAYG